MAMDDRTRRNLEKIFDTIEKRKETFGNVLVGFAFSKNNKNELRLCFGLLKFLRKGEAPLKKITYDYGDFILTKETVDLNNALILLHSLFENQILKFERRGEIPLKVYMAETKYVESNKRYWYVSSEWPMLYAYGRIDDGVRGNIPGDSVSKLGLPLFPDGTEAINVFLELHLPKDWSSTLESRIELLVPDYRARIKNLRLAGNRIAVEVEIGETAKANVKGKFYCKSESKSYSSEDLPLEAGRVNFMTDEEPFQVESHIISTLDGETIDRRKFDYRYPSAEEGVIIENIEDQLLDTISKGENVTVEFKQKLDNEEFLETVVAFANTIGGTIFLGVDDNSRITEFRENVKAKIMDLIAAHCDPSIEVDIDSGVRVQDIPITLVKVPEGTNKPYTLKERGIYVRRGSSDRQIKRTELDDMYAEKRQSGTIYR